MKNVVKKLAPLFALLLVVVLLGFVTRHQNQMPCQGLDVAISSEAEMYFIDKIDVENHVINASDSVVGKRMIDLNTLHIEQVIETLPEVKKADVYKTINGRLKVNVELRVPVARVFNKNGNSFYIDKQGEMMPLSTKYSARILTVNGNIHQPQNAGNAGVMVAERFEKQLREIHEIASFIAADSFWSAQIQQVYVDEKLEYVLIPRVGNYEIQFGKMTDIETKFLKLNSFYEQALSKTDWNKYKTINLKYKDQIVCFKK
jgi:cell division protein FtsQ